MSDTKVEASAGSDGAIVLDLPVGITKIGCDTGKMRARVHASVENEWGKPRVFFSISMDPIHIDLFIPSESARALGNALIDRASAAEQLPPPGDDGLRRAQEDEEVAIWNAR